MTSRNLVTLDEAKALLATQPKRSKYFERLLARFTVNPDTECWEWQRARRPEGYGVMNVGDRTVKTHRLAANLFFGLPLDSPLLVLHHCDNPPCFNPDHLFLGTKKDNTQDALKKDRFGPIAGKNTVAKLTRDDVLRVRALLATGQKCAPIARQLGLTRITVSHIKNKRNWNHVT